METLLYGTVVKGRGKRSKVESNQENGTKNSTMRRLDSLGRAGKTLQTHTKEIWKDYQVILCRAMHARICHLSPVYTLCKQLLGSPSQYVLNN